MAFQEAHITGSSGLGSPTGLVTSAFPDYAIRFQVRPEEHPLTQGSPFAGLNSLQMHAVAPALAGPSAVKTTAPPSAPSDMQAFLPSVAGPFAVNAIAATTSIAGLKLYLNKATKVDAVALGVVALVALLDSQIFFAQVQNQTTSSNYNLFLSLCALGALAYLGWNLFEAFA